MPAACPTPLFPAPSPRLASPAAFCGVLINSITIARRRSFAGRRSTGVLEYWGAALFDNYNIYSSRCGGANNSLRAEEISLAIPQRAWKNSN